MIDYEIKKKNLKRKLSEKLKCVRKKRAVKKLVVLSDTNSVLSHLYSSGSKSRGKILPV